MKDNVRDTICKKGMELAISVMDAMDIQSKLEILIDNDEIERVSKKI